MPSPTTTFETLIGLIRLLFRNTFKTMVFQHQATMLLTVIALNIIHSMARQSRPTSRFAFTVDKLPLWLTLSVYSAFYTSKWRIECQMAPCRCCCCCCCRQSGRAANKQRLKSPFVWSEAALRLQYPGNTDVWRRVIFVTFNRTARIHRLRFSCWHSTGFSTQQRATSSDVRCHGYNDAYAPVAESMLMRAMTKASVVRHMYK